MAQIKIGAVASPYPEQNLDYWVRSKAQFLQTMRATTVRVSLFTGDMGRGAAPRFTYPHLDMLLKGGGDTIQLSEMIINSREAPTINSDISGNTVKSELEWILPYIAHVSRDLNAQVLFVYEIGNEPNDHYKGSAEQARNDTLDCLQYLRDLRRRGALVGNTGMQLPDNLIWAFNMPNSRADTSYIDPFLSPRDGESLLQPDPSGDVPLRYTVTVNCYGVSTLTRDDPDLYRLIGRVRQQNQDINIKVTEAGLGTPIQEERDRGEGYARGEGYRQFVRDFESPPAPDDLVYQGVDSVCFYATPCVEPQIYNLTFNTARRIAGFASAFADVSAGHPYSAAIENLAALGIVRGYEGLGGRFGVDDPIARAQMAAIICRSMPGGGKPGAPQNPGNTTSIPGVGPSTWANETWPNPFTDQCDPSLGCIDPDLWRNVGTLVHYDVARGYDAEHFVPFGPVIYAQMISFIARAMVAKGYWQQQPDDPALYPNVSPNSGHRADIATYAHYVGPVPDTDVQTQDFPNWDQPAPRGWCAQALWQGSLPDAALYLR